MFGPQLMPLWIVIPGVVSAGLFYAGKYFNVRMLRLCAFIPLIIGLLVGVSGIMQLGDILYRDFNDITPKREIVHYAVAAVPFLAILGLAFIEFVKTNPKQRQL